MLSLEGVDSLGDLNDSISPLEGSVVFVAHREAKPYSFEIGREGRSIVGLLLKHKGGEQRDDLLRVELGQHILKDQLREDKLVSGVDLIPDQIRLISANTASYLANLLHRRLSPSVELGSSHQ